MMSWLAIISLAAVQLASSQILEPSPGLTAPGIGFNSVHGSFHQPQFQNQGVLPHRDVVVNAEHEALLPSHLKNPFYKNPRIAEALAHHSWFGPGETQVFDRETNHIPRQRIFSVLKNAGLARK